MNTFSIKRNRNTWLVLYVMGCLSTALSAQAASFDCAKASTKVEKLICGDAGLSKLDQELSSAYKAALQDRNLAEPVKQAQKLWMKERDGCADEDCVKRAYESRLAALTSHSGESYSLVMSKDAKLCNAMLALYNADMKAYKKIWYDHHEMFTDMWESVDLDEANHPTYGCMQYLRGIFDINNDGKSELVIKRSACLSGILKDSLFIYPDNSDVLSFNPKFGKLSPLKDTNDEFDEDIYCLKDQHACLDVHFVLNPFIWEKTSYISITDQTPRWIVIAKYKQAAEMQDICYFYNPSIARQF